MDLVEAFTSFPPVVAHGQQVEEANEVRTQQMTPQSQSPHQQCAVSMYEPRHAGPLERIGSMNRASWTIAAMLAKRMQENLPVCIALKVRAASFRAVPRPPGRPQLRGIAR